MWNKLKSILKKELKIFIIIALLALVASGISLLMEGNFLAPLILWPLAYFIYKRLPKQKREVPKKERLRKKTFETYVAGVTKKNSDGKEVQPILKKYVMSKDPVDGFEVSTDKEILELGEDVWRYEYFEKDTIDLVPEPTNPYDKDAIKVIHHELGHIGYIPAKHTKVIHPLLKTNAIYEIIVEYHGGAKKKIKYGSYEDKVERTNSPFYMELTINYKQF